MNQELEIEQDLEPISTIIRLAILNYKIEGTKISIQNNTIYIQEPGYYQSAIRYLYNDNRNDLNLLKNPIIKALKWIECNLTMYKDNILFILKKSILGLLKLSKSYQQDDKIYAYILSLSQTIQNYVYDNILIDETDEMNNVDKVWKEKSDIDFIKTIFETIDTQLKDRIVNLDEIYTKINTELQPIENLLQRKDVLYISKINSNSYLIQ